MSVGVDRELKSATDALMEKVEQFALHDQETVDEELRGWLEWMRLTCEFFAPLPENTNDIHEWILQLQERFRPSAHDLRIKGLQMSGGQVKARFPQTPGESVQRPWQSLTKDVEVLSDLVERAYLRWDYAVYHAHRQIRVGHAGVEAVRFMRAAWDDYYRLLEELRWMNGE